MVRLNAFVLATLPCKQSLTLPPPQAKGVAKADSGDKPKRPLGSYFIFQAERREIVKKANPTFSVKEIASKIGEEWRALSDAQKQK